MKDIYELLNEMDMDLEEFEEMKVSELEKAKVKKTLMKNITRKNKKQRWKRSMTAAAIAVGISTTALFGLSFTANAEKIPVIGNIFKFFNHVGLYDNYNENANEINITKESNGVKMTVNDAIFDGKSVNLTFSIESDKDLGENPSIMRIGEIKDQMGGTGKVQLSKVAEKSYVGIMTITDLSRDTQDEAYVKWKPEYILVNEGEKEIKGNWRFDFHLQATDSEVKMIDKTVNGDGLAVTIENMTLTPMSFIMYYSQGVSKELSEKWDDIYVEIEIKDDLGNSYSGEGNGGTGKDAFEFNWSKTFQKLDPRASKLIVTPHVMLTNFGPDEHGGVEISSNGRVKVIENTTTNNESKREEFTLEDIIVELK